MSRVVNVATGYTCHRCQTIQRVDETRRFVIHAKPGFRRRCYGSRELVANNPEPRMPQQSWEQGIWFR